MKGMKEAQVVEGATLDLKATSSNPANVKAFSSPKLKIQLENSA